jgi:PAS domain S-box-containing protein
MNQASPIGDTAGVRVGSVGLWTDISVRRQAEQVLRHFELVVNSITDLVSVVDEHLVYHLVNDAWCSAVGLTREQALGRTTAELLPDGGGAARSHALADCLQSQQVRTARAAITMPSLAGQMMETTYYPYAKQGAGPRLVVMVTRNVTEQETSRQALELSAEYLRRTLNATGDAIFASDADTATEPLRFVNAQLLQLWGIPQRLADRLTPADIMAHALPLMAEPEVQARLIEDVVTHNKRHESQVLLRDGRVLLRRCEPAQVGTRSVRVWSFRDITAETRALQSLQERDAEQRALLDAFPGYIAAMDGAMRYTYVNDRMAEVLGAPAHGLVGRSLQEVIGDNRAAVVADLFRRARAGERVVQARRFRRPGASGELLDLEMTHVVGHASDGGQQICYAFGVDISARLRAETLLISARDEAERANLAKSQFLSQMSHELRTPMNAILGFGQLLESDSRHALAVHQQRWVREILRGARHLLELINEVLDLGRIEAGHLHIEPAEVDLGELVAQCLALVRPLAPSLGVQLHADARHLAGVRVRADATRLKQVLLNLLGNAIKYNRVGGEVSVGCEHEPGHVRLLVHDTGHGLVEADQQRLFQPFERLHAANSGVEGTGIGLALSRRLVEAMDGTIGVQSVVGVGSTFWVRLPAVAQGRLEGDDGNAPAPAPLSPSAAEGTVLYIEDNPVNLALMDAMLGRLPGVRVLATMVPAEGLRLAHEQQPALVLLDIQLPGMDGFDVLARLRADARTAHIPVIAVSANALPGDIDAALAAGFAAYLTKPLELELLLHSVRSVLAGGASPSAP